MLQIIPWSITDLLMKSHQNAWHHILNSCLHRAPNTQPLAGQASSPIIDIMSRRVKISICRPPYRSILSYDALHDLPLCRSPHHFRLPPTPPTRHSSSSSSSTTSNSANKSIVLEQPDKFRPPSHPARLNARRMPRQYPGPPIPKAEQEAQATRRYPHTFPNEGTRMFWFLTNRRVHLWISLVRF